MLANFSSSGLALLLLHLGASSQAAIVIDVVVPALLDVDVHLLLVAALAIILLARTTAGTVTETMIARADVTGIGLAALTIGIFSIWRSNDAHANHTAGTVSVTPKMTVMIVTVGRTVRMVTSARVCLPTLEPLDFGSLWVQLSIVLLLLTTILMLPSRRLSDNKRLLVISDQATQVKVSAICLGPTLLPIFDRSTV